MKHCPACESSRWVTALKPQGVLERFLLRAVLVRPFLCRHCQSRFRRFSLKSSSDAGLKGARADEVFIKEPQPVEFEELVDELREAERRLGEARLKSMGSKAGSESG